MKSYYKARELFAIGLTVVSFSTDIARAAYWETLGTPSLSIADSKYYGPNAGLDIDISGTIRAEQQSGRWSDGARNGWYDATNVSGSVGIQRGLLLKVDLIETSNATGAPRFAPSVGDSFEIVRAGQVRWLSSGSSNISTWVDDPAGGPHTMVLNTADAPLASNNWQWRARQHNQSIYLDVTTDLRNKIGLMSHDPIAPERLVPQRAQLPVSAGSDGLHSSILDLSLLDADAGSVDLTGDIQSAPLNTPVDVLIEIGGSNRLEAVAKYVDDYAGSSDFVAYMAGDDPFESAKEKYPGEWSMLVRFINLPGSSASGNPVRFVWDFAADQKDDGDGAILQRIVVVPEPHALAAVVVFVAYFARRRFGWRGC